MSDDFGLNVGFGTFLDEEGITIRQKGELTTMSRTHENLRGEIDRIRMDARQVILLNWRNASLISPKYYRSLFKTTKNTSIG